MKKVFITLTIGCLFVFYAAAQDTKSTIKLNVLSLIFTNISLQYEYTLNGNSSVCLGASYLPERGLPSVGAAADNKDKVEDFSFSGFSITPEYRYYFKGNGPKGLYLAGYVRYAQYSSSEAGYNFERDDGTTEEVKISGDYTSTVVGIMLGSQWLLGEKFTLDWWIIGAGFGSQKGTYTGKGDFDATDQADIKESVDDVSFGGIDISVETTSTQVDLTIENNLPAIRGFGLCIGYRF